MKTLLIALSLLCTGLAAQDAPKPEGEKPAQPKPEAEKPSEATAPTSLGLTANFTDYVKRNYPDIDPAGEHDVFKLKNPTDPAKRHAYTSAMLKLTTMYVDHLSLGPTLIKLFDQYSRGQEAAQPVFKVLYAQLLAAYPPGNPDNRALARKMLLEAGSQSPDYAYPWYILGEMELAAVQVRGEAALADAFKYADSALRIRPDFPAAIAMKADLLCQVRPPRSGEAVKLLEPLLEKPPAMAEDMDAVLTAYLRAAGVQDGVAAIEKLLKREGVSKPLVARGRQVGAAALRFGGNLDEALKWMETALSEMKPETEATSYVNGVRFTADCWGMKAMALVKREGGVAPADKSNYDKCIAEAMAWYRKATEFEAQLLPIELRGRQAIDYMLFLKGTGNHEQALIWVKKYLENNSLPALHRTVLELEEMALRISLDPQEADMLAFFAKLLDAGELEKLAVALIEAGKQLANRGVGFKTDAALKFFIEQLKSRNRTVVMCAGTLAADTALRQTAKAQAAAAEAIVTRLLEETECVNEEQGELQQNLCEALRDLKQWAPLARAVRHYAKMVEAQAGTLGKDMARVTNVFSSERFVKLVPDAPEALGASSAKHPKRLAPWLGQLAEKLEKTPQEPPAGAEKPADSSAKPN